MDIEEDLTFNIAKEISDQIDKDVLWDIYYKDCFPYMIPDMGSTLNMIIERDEWLSINVGKKGDCWEWYQDSFYFKNKKDLAWFILRWS